MVNPVTTLSLSSIERRRQMYGSAVTINDAELDVLLECARACRGIASIYNPGCHVEETKAAIAAGKKVGE